MKSMFFSDLSSVIRLFSFHSFIVESCEPLIKVVLSGKEAKQVIESAWAFIVLNSCPFNKFQSFIVLSLEPLANI